MATEMVGWRPMSRPAPRFLPSLAPALLISMGFIDVGKWVVAVEGGAQFGFNPVLLVLLFNCSAIFCQYLAICIGAVTGKNLAQICFEEYYKPASLLLGIQAEVSRIVSDLSTILGIAHGFYLLFGVDLLICTILAAIVAIAFPASVKFLGKHINEVQIVGISGLVLIFYVLGILLAQPEVPVSTMGTFPRLSLENSYLVMAFLGSNIMVHNFYYQSAVVQQQRRSLSVAVDHLRHDHFFATLLIFSGIFLANCVLINSATSLFENAGITFQDVFLLMDQMFNIHIAPFVFFLVLLLSSLISTFAWLIGGQVVINDLLGIDFSFWTHLACSKAVVVIPALYHAQTSGAEGLYQLLIFCQVILAVLLPSSVIPLFRVASSKPLMGTFTMSWYLEILALFTFIWMFSSNLVFITEALFGDGSWIINLRSSMTLPFVFLLLVACMSLGLTSYLMVAPLKSACNESIWEFQNSEQLLLYGHRNNSSATDYHEVHETAAEPAALGPGKLPRTDFNIDNADTTSDSLNKYQTASDLNLETALTSSASDIVIKESLFSTDLHTVEAADKLPESDKMDLGICGKSEPNQPLAERTRVELAVDSHKGEEISWEQADFLEEILAPATTEGSEAPKTSKSKSNDAGSGTGSLSRLSGLGRAARRQFAATLDEFWGHLFDFHGQLTQEAWANKMDVLLGLDLKSISPAKSDASTSETMRKHLPETERGSGFQMSSRDYSFPGQTKIPTKGSIYGFQTGSPSWFSGSQADLYGQRSSDDPAELGERRYSSLHLPQHADIRDYQPATIHGYQISSYVRGIGAGRVDSSGFSLNRPLSPKPPESFIPSYITQLKYIAEHEAFGSLGASKLETRRFSGVSRQADLSSYDPSSGGIYEDSLASEKKYHSLPDISGISGLSRNSFNNRTLLQSGQIGPHPSVARTPIGQPQCTNLSYRTEGAPLTFDELSPSTPYKDILSSHSPSVVETKSLWSRQPYEQLFGMSDNSQAHDVATDIPSLRPETVSYAELEGKLLKSFKDCITKVLKLEGSDWLFRQSSGADEELINQFALKEKFLQETEITERDAVYFSVYQHLSPEENSSVQGTDQEFCSHETFVKCGESCTWRAGLVVSFGVWCIRRILELSLVESRPELWGKYTYVLNRLQGILEPAFSKPRSPMVACPCPEIPVACIKDFDRNPQNSILQRMSMPVGARWTTSGMVLDLIKDVEVAISSRKGRSGTAAGDVAFPKGKENLASVLKRYKRRLSNKSSGTNGGSSSRKLPQPTASPL